MRICRYQQDGQEAVGFYFDTFVVSIAEALRLHEDATHQKLEMPTTGNLLDYLPPAGKQYRETKQLGDFLARHKSAIPVAAQTSVEKIQLLLPIPKPNKLFLLAGNYAKHIEEGGGIAEERRDTFPYVFMKPPTTTLTNPGEPISVPAISPDAIDWELELAVVIGKEVKGIKEADALTCVAGYTVINDISNRRFRPNPGRKERPKDTFFDWLHGKWFDSFCPCGPCITSADAILDPQQLKLQLKVNDTLRQDSSTAQQIFPVAAVIEFISSFVTLEPGDIISTGTPAGVGNTTKTYLQPGDQISASISEIGDLRSTVIAES
ncbi:MAG: fumarylacetoacetate hydrolase family protein [Planctomycetaceae bacterium]|nr:fumarylacetoacetate hydrolase family protein [Planctomycetaceae bacterium]